MNKPDDSVETANLELANDERAHLELGKGEATGEKLQSYILVAHANLHKQPQATVELIQYINSAMRNYRMKEDKRVVNKRKFSAHQRWRRRQRRSQEESQSQGQRASDQDRNQGDLDTSDGIFDEPFQDRSAQEVVPLEIGAGSSMNRDEAGTLISQGEGKGQQAQVQEVEDRYGWTMVHTYSRRDLLQINDFTKRKQHDWLGEMIQRIPKSMYKLFPYNRSVYKNMVEPQVERDVGRDNKTLTGSDTVTASEQDINGDSFSDSTWSAPEVKGIEQGDLEALETIPMMVIGEDMLDEKPREIMDIPGVEDSSTVIVVTENGQVKRTIRPRGHTAPYRGKVVRREIYRMGKSSTPVPMELFKKGQRQIVSIPGTQDEGIRVRVVEESPVKSNHSGRSAQKGRMDGRKDNQTKGTQQPGLLENFKKMNLDGALSTSSSEEDTYGMGMARERRRVPISPGDEADVSSDSWSWLNPNGRDDNGTKTPNNQSQEREGSLLLETPPEMRDGPVSRQGNRDNQLLETPPEMRNSQDRRNRQTGWSSGWSSVTPELQGPVPKKADKLDRPRRKQQVIVKGSKFIQGDETEMDTSTSSLLDSKSEEDRPYKDGSHCTWNKELERLIESQKSQADPTLEELRDGRQWVSEESSDIMDQRPRGEQVLQEEVINRMISSSEEADDPILSMLAGIPEGDISSLEASEMGAIDPCLGSYSSPDPGIEIETSQLLQSEEEALERLPELTMDRNTEEMVFNDRMDQFIAHSQQHPNQEYTESKKLAMKLNTPDAFIVGLQEFAWNSHNLQVTHLKGHLIHADKSAKPGPRAAILASKNMQVWGVPKFTNRDTATVMWLVEGAPFKKVYFVSSYHQDTTNEQDPARKKPVIDPIIEKLLAHSEREGSQVVILADTNAHSSLWHMPKTNARGAEFERMVADRHLHVLNKGNVEENWTWSGMRDGEMRKTIIDVTFCTPGIADYATNWRVRNGAPISDHRSIEFIIPLAGTTDEWKRQYAWTDWDKFEEALENMIEEVVVENLDGDKWSPEDLEQEMTRMYEDIYTALEEVCPKRKLPQRIPHVPWWDSSLEELKKKARILQKTLRWMRRNPGKQPRHPTTYEEVKAAFRVYNKACKKAKRRSWRQFIEGTDSFLKTAALGRLLKRAAYHEVGLLKDSGGEECGPEESLNILSSEHFPESRTEPTGEGPRPNRLKKEDIMGLNVEWITAEKIKAAFAKFSPFKGAGPDELPPIVMKHFGKKMIARLTRIYKASVALGVLPTKWLEVKVIYIPKPGKDSYDVPRSFRPISLMSFLMKGLERLMLWHYETEVLDDKPFHRNQHGFRKGMSCDTAISQVSEEIEKAFQQGDSVMLVDLDIKGAYDNLTYTDIVEALQKRGAPREYVKWHEYFLYHRSLSIKHKGVEIVRYPTKGTPQGAICSPAHWNEVSDSFHSLYDGSEIMTSGYADDTSIFITGKDLVEMRNKLQIGVDRAQYWAQEHGLEFSTAKTKSIIFTRQKREDWVEPSKLKMYGQEISFTTEIGHLGVLMDQSLTWRSHIMNKIKKCKGLLMKFHRAQKIIWGLPPQYALWAYKGIARPALTHACLVWHHATRHKYIQDKLRSFQLQGLRMLGFTRKSTPARGLEIITNTWPLHLHIKGLALRSHIRTKHLTRYSAEELHTIRVKTRGHRQWLREEIIRRGMVDPDVQSDRQILRQKWNKQYEIGHESMDKRRDDWGKPYLYWFEYGDRVWNIYTDGSRDDNQEKAGSGLVVYKDGETKFEASFGIGDRTVFQAEVFAIKQAALWLLRPENRVSLENAVIFIYSDSQAAIQALDGNFVSSKLVWSTMTLLEEAKKWVKLGKIQIRWVKAHVGFEGNEKADSLAKLGLDQPIHPDSPHDPEALINAALMAMVNVQWIEDWSAEPTCRQTKHWFPYPRPDISFKILRTQRRIYSVLVQIMTGHNYMQRHQHLIDTTNGVEGDGPTCLLCKQGEMTSEHIIGQCEELIGIRIKHFTEIELKPPFINLSLAAVIGFLREVPIVALQFFLEEE